MKFARLLLWFFVIVLLPVGVLYVVDPVGSAGWTGMLLPTPAAMTDVRAYYGMLQLSLAVFLMWSLRTEAGVYHGLKLMQVLFAGLALGRVVGVLLDGGAQGFNLGALGFEGLATVLSTWALRQVEGAQAKVAG
ncbi:MAG: DUF4345 domain-containing protein [Myxococcota bacterium]